MSEMAPEKPVNICLVCSSPLPSEYRRGRPRKVCRDEDSPTPGGCARERNEQKKHASYDERPGTQRRSRPTPYRYFPNGGFIIE